MRPRNTYPSMYDFVAQLPTGAVLKQGETMYPNARIESLTGYRPEELSSMDKWMKNLHGEQWKEYMRQYQKDREAGFLQNRTMPIRCKDGRTCWVECSRSLQKEAELWIFHDLTPLWQSRDAFLTEKNQLTNRLDDRTEYLSEVVNRLLSTHRSLTEHRELNQRLLEALRALQGIVEQIDSSPANSRKLSEKIRELQQALRYAASLPEKLPDQNLLEVKTKIWKLTRRLVDEGKLQK